MVKRQADGKRDEEPEGENGEGEEEEHKAEGKVTK